MGELKRLMDIVDKVNASKESSEEKMREIMDLFGLNPDNTKIKKMTNKINTIR